MHCLGAGGGTSSPKNGAGGGQGGVLSVFRALGVLVCEGRIQGPPRGYKEGPHCAPPMQAVPNDHVCEENNYLCNRYSVLIQEIAEYLSTGTNLCVEVLLCSDCPCGLAKSTCKCPVYPMPSLSISPWQKCTSEMLLEYWCICVVPSKSPEPMNFQGLYQAVRSRLHFSQVAAWWSRSNGAEPSYVATRIVPHDEDSLDKFREMPVEHTFPLAGNGDGNSIKVTVWALPRMEEVPVLACSLHPKKEKDEEDIARALTPTKSVPIGSVGAHNLECLVLPVLVDDRLQTTCNRSGKHDCRCEEEDASPLSPTINRSNSERKRRRSLPCGPAESNPCVTSQQPPPLPSLQEYILQEVKDNVNSSAIETANNNNRGAARTLPNKSEERKEVMTRNNLNSDHLESMFKLQLKIERPTETTNNLERYKRATTTEIPEVTNSRHNVNRIKEVYNNSVKNSNGPGKEPAAGGCSSDVVTPAAKSVGGLLDNLAPFAPAGWSFVSSWQNSNTNNARFQSFRGAKETRFNDTSEKDYKVTDTITNPSNYLFDYYQPSPFHESNPGPSTYKRQMQKSNNSVCTVHQSCSKNINKIVTEARVSTGQDALEINKEDNTVKSGGQRKAGGGKSDLSQLMWKLSASDNENDKKEEGGLLDWFSKVPGRVLSVAATKGYVDGSATAKSENPKQHPAELNRNVRQQQQQQQQQQCANEFKFKSYNLELSRREVDEVLAVLRARTPAGRRKTTVKNTRKRGERAEKGADDVVTTDKVPGKCCASSDEGGVVARNNSTNRHVKASSCHASSYATKPCENCNVTRIGSYKRMDCRVVTEESADLLDGICRDENAYRLARLKQLAEGTDRSNNEEDTTREEVGANEDANRLRNVSTKADVLLRAILRTSKDRKDLSSDVSSNGTRLGSTTGVPRDNSSDDESQSSSVEKFNGQRERGTVASLPNDERSMPLNKRFHRFRQLFKKEVDKRIAMMMDENSSFSSSSSSSSSFSSSQDTTSSSLTLPRTFNSSSFRYNNEQPHMHNARYNKAKRRIDFVNVPKVTAGKEYEATTATATTATTTIVVGLGTKDAHQKSRKTYSTNNDRERDPAGLNNRRDRYDGRSLEDMKELIACEEERGENTKDIAVPRNNNLTTPVISQSGQHSSSKIRNNNHEDHGIAEAVDDETVDKSVPSALEQERFRRSLENAASMVFHSRTGLPLTSSPAPLRRGSCCFDYDSSLNSVSSKRSALFELNTPPSPGAVSLEETDRETENAGEGEETSKRRSSSRHRPQSHALLGSFEESALNGRLEPVSTVHGFTAELGASGSFCPKHQKLPVTVFFYTLGDNDKVSTPYLAHINLEKKGYQIPRSGTIQVTLLNPLGTVVKMFVVLYDLSDMPPRSHTFLRQRTLRDKTLRYLVHLRFMSSKSGRIYLHTDIRMIICRKSDVDTASELGSESPKELRSYIHGPTNPKFSPRC